MRNSYLLAAAALAIATVACSKKEPAQNAALNDTTLVDNTVSGDMNTTAAAPMGDADFANAVASGGRYEVDSSNLAATRASSPAVKSLASMIAADHKKAGADLKAAASKAPSPFTPADGLTTKQKADLEALKAAKGAEFDKLYVSQQIAAHEEALSALHGYAAGGATPSLKEFASKMATAVQAHLDKLNTLQL